MKRRKRIKPRKVRKYSGKLSKPRKYFGKPSQLMINTIIHAAIRVLRRERRKLRNLLAEEYAGLNALRKKYPTEIPPLFISIEKEAERLKHVIMAEEGRI